ncbi:hypothetical protein T4D_10256 [Trichinella pseudospiralis]|uniref:Uncharacterized protein n=1 Tax=Trichinella pseudospiralis TaxID=6337 RepID=A0A0V1FD13_TRIPS|nr:hypothetical protein T4D_10256 [Trichinella pseudospiralis]
MVNRDSFYEIPAIEHANVVAIYSTITGQGGLRFPKTP